jgi:guanylate kinase
MPSGLVFIVSGPAGVGKDAVLAGLAARGIELGRVVTAVTRPPRAGEVEGVDYYFVSRERFAEMVAADELLEWADYVGSPRGTPLFSLRRTLERGKDAVLKIDVDGFRQVRQHLPHTVSIFIAPPDLDTLAARMRSRAADTPEQIAARLERAAAELAVSPEYDYVLVNHEGALDQTIDALATIVAAERARVPSRAVTIP